MDLTKITTPFGLLDEATQEALKAHGGPWEVYSGVNGWSAIGFPQWVALTVYRVKSAPPKPREWWLRVGADGSVRSASTARINACGCHEKIIHVREVLE